MKDETDPPLVTQGYLCVTMLPLWYTECYCLPGPFPKVRSEYVRDISLVEIKKNGRQNVNSKHCIANLYLDM